MTARLRQLGFVLVATACAVGAVVSLTAVRPTRAHRTVADAPQVRTPLVSARRVPTLLVRTVESATQSRAADALTKKLIEIVASVHACVAVDGIRGSLARIGTDQALDMGAQYDFYSPIAATSNAVGLKVGWTFLFNTK